MSRSIFRWRMIGHERSLPRFDSRFINEGRHTFDQILESYNRHNGLGAHVYLKLRSLLDGKSIVMGVLITLSYFIILASVA